MSILNRVLTVARWILGILFVLVGATNFAHPIAAILSLLIAAILIPPAYRFIQSRTGRTLPKSVTAVGLIVLIIAWGIALPESDGFNDNEVINQQDQTTTASPESSGDITNLLDTADEESEPTSEESTPEPQSTPSPIISPITQPKTESPKKIETTKSSCDPNYSDCVPIASDVDCAGGSGNGPAYTGMVNVIGSDIYDLDRDHDGIACE